MGNYQCYKCGIPEDHAYIDELHLKRRHCRYHCPDKSCLICKDCSDHKNNSGCYHKFKFIWWCQQKNRYKNKFDLR